MRKLIQFLTIGLACYNLYLAIDDFLDTPAGEALKEKVMEYAEPAANAASGFASKVMDRVEESANKIKDETVAASQDVAAEVGDFSNDLV